MRAYVAQSLPQHARCALETNPHLVQLYKLSLSMKAENHSKQSKNKRLGRRSVQLTWLPVCDSTAPERNERRKNKTKKRTIPLGKKINQAISHSTTDEAASLPLCLHVKRSPGTQMSSFFLIKPPQARLQEANRRITTPSRILTHQMCPSSQELSESMQGTESTGGINRQKPLLTDSTDEAA